MSEIELNEQVSLRPIHPDNHAEHFALMKRVYPPAFNYLWPDNGTWYVEQTHGKTALLADLAEPDAPYQHVYFKNKLIGIYRLKLNSINPDFPDEPALKLDRLYLDDTIRNHGIGSLLIDHAKVETLKLGKQLLWLERMGTNDATIGFYYKHGFVDGGQFRLPFELMYPHFRGMYRIAWRVDGTLG
jgi:ribosomal protein S18 acetylase RimI-like enzyme